MAAATAAIALTLAACGSGDGEDATDSVTPATIADDTGTAGSDTATTTPSDDTTAPATDGTAPATDGTTAPDPTGAQVVPDILQFSAPLVGGGTFDGAAVAGIPTAFWFWAPT
jgi:hypothetical protein